LSQAKFVLQAELNSASAGAGMFTFVYTSKLYPGCLIELTVPLFGKQKEFVQSFRVWKWMKKEKQP
jgi:hypothetical protein